MRVKQSKCADAFRWEGTVSHENSAAADRRCDDEEAEVGARGRMSEGFSYRDSAPGILPPAESIARARQAK